MDGKIMLNTRVVEMTGVSVQQLLRSNYLMHHSTYVQHACTACITISFMQCYIVQPIINPNHSCNCIFYPISRLLLESIVSEGYRISSQKLVMFSVMVHVLSVYTILLDHPTKFVSHGLASFSYHNVQVFFKNNFLDDISTIYNSSQYYGK